LKKDQGNGQSVPERMGRTLEQVGPSGNEMCGILARRDIDQHFICSPRFAVCMFYRGEGIEEALPRMCCMDRIKDFSGKVENSTSDPNEFKELTKNSWQREELARLNVIE
jgi:hypothetical protein